MFAVQMRVRHLRQQIDSAPKEDGTGKNQDEEAESPTSIFDISDPIWPLKSLDSDPAEEMPTAGFPNMDVLSLSSPQTTNLPLPSPARSPTTTQDLWSKFKSLKHGLESFKSRRMSSNDSEKLISSPRRALFNNDAGEGEESPVQSATILNSAAKPKRNNLQSPMRGTPRQRRDLLGEEKTSPVRDVKTSVSTRTQSRIPARSARGTPRFGTLTKENLASLSSPDDGAKKGPRSQASALTELGTSGTSSRLYKPDILTERLAKLEARKKEMEMRACTFKPQINEKTPQRRLRRSNSIESIESIQSVRSVRTDITPVSSRLYQSDYVQRREQRLKRMKEEHDLRECTFKPKTNLKPNRTMPSAA